MRNENENHALIFEKLFSLCQSQRLIKNFGNLNQHQGEDELRHVSQNDFIFTHLEERSRALCSTHVAVVDDDRSGYELKVGRVSKCFYAVAWFK